MTTMLPIHSAGRRLLHAAGLLTALSSLPADAQMYRYVDNRTGYRVYSTVPVPPPSPLAASTAPQAQSVQTAQPAPAPPRSAVRRAEKKQSDRAVSDTIIYAPPSRAERTVIAPRRVSHAAFPRVSREEQQERDAERRRIIEEELRNEEEFLARALDRNAGADILRLSANIGALRRELATIR